LVFAAFQAACVDFTLLDPLEMREMQAVHDKS
jgi:hypothetical protein